MKEEIIKYKKKNLQKKTKERNFVKKTNTNDNKI